MSNIKITDLSELLTVDSSNTILFATDLSVSPNVSHYVRSGTLTQTDYALANAAFLRANVAYSTGQSANLALLISNLAFNKGNSAYTQAVTGTNLAQAAYNQANVDFVYAGSAFTKANSGTVLAQSAFDKANSGTVLAQSSFDKANSDFVHANSAFNLANTLNNSTSLNLAQAAYNQANTDFVHANSAFNKANSTLVYATSGYNVANSAYSGAVSGTILAQSAFDKANSDQVLAQSAYNQANTSITNNGSVLAQAAFNKANSGTVLAQSAFDKANTAIINNGSVLAQAAFDKANSTFVYSTAGFMQANSAYSLATGAVMRAGDTITGIVMAPTAANGTSNTMIATTQFVNNELSYVGQGLGVGQTWQNVKSSRALGTSYTNSSGKTICVYVRGEAESGELHSGYWLRGTVNGIEVAHQQAADTTINNAEISEYWLAVNFIVPNGATYSVSGNGTTNEIYVWSELR